MKYAILGWLLAAFLIAPAPAAPLEGRIAQISWLELHQYRDMRNFFADLRARGFEGVILRAFHNRGDRYLQFEHQSKRPAAGVYFATTHAPVIQDLFTQAVEAARHHEMRIYGWMSGRRLEWLPPDSPLIDAASGQISLFRDNALEYLETLYADLARTGVDGILIQDDLIYRTGDELPSDIAVRTPEGAYSDAYRDLVHQRALRIAEVVDRLAAAVHRVSPDISMAMNLYYENGTNPEHARLWTAQDLELLARTQVDQFLIMSYHHQISQELDLDAPEAIALAARIVQRLSDQLGPERVVAKIQTIDFGADQPLPAEDIGQLEALLPAGIPRAFMPIRGLL